MIGVSASLLRKPGSRDALDPRFERPPPVSSQMIYEDEAGRVRQLIQNARPLWSEALLRDLSGERTPQRSACASRPCAHPKAQRIGVEFFVCEPSDEAIIHPRVGA